MDNKRILIVDQDEMVLSILKKSLHGFEPNTEVITVTDGQTALGCLPGETFNVIITDFTYLTRDDYQLFDAIRLTQSPAPLMVVTAYPNSDLSLSRDGLQISHTLLKPIELGNLNSLLKKIYVQGTSSNQASLNLTAQLYDASQQMINDLLRETNARCIVLTDTDGRILLQSGATQDMAIDEVTALLGGGIATLLEAGKNLSDEAVINLTYREGRLSDLYAINIGIRLILVLVIDRGPFYNRLGTVWFYARQTAIKLMDKMEQAAALKPTQVFDENTSEDYNNELDKLFNNLTI